MPIKIWLDKNWKLIIKGLIYSLLVSLLYIVAAISPEKTSDTFVAVCVLQLGLSMIWLIVRMGLLSTASYGSRRFIKSSIKKRNDMIGVYDSRASKSNINFQNNDSPMELEENARRKSKVPIYTMWIVGLLELIIALIVLYF